MTDNNNLKPSRALGAVVFGLAKVLFRPEVHFENGETGNRLTLNEPTLLVCNHINHLDGTIIAYLLRKSTMHCLAAKDRFEQGGFMRWYLEKSGCIPIDRKGVSTDWIHSSVKILRTTDEHIAIFPEGRHGKNGEILPFHSGAAVISALSGAPVLLVCNKGPYKLFRKCRLNVSEPFRLPAPENGMTAEYISGQTDFLRDKMIELSNRG